MDEPAGKQPGFRSRRALGLIAGSVAAVVVLFLLDALAFRTRAYSPLLILRQMFTGPRGVWLLEWWQLGLAGIALPLAVAEEKLAGFDRLVAAPAWAYASAVLAALVCLELFGVTDMTIPFVYFQF